MEQVHGVDIYTIYDIVFIPWWKQQWFMYVSAGITTICLVALFWYVYKKRKNRSISVYQQLLQQLDTLSFAEDPENFKKTYTILVSIFKHFCHYAYGSSLALTDDELLQSIRTNFHMSDEVKNVAQALLSYADYIKFGNAHQTVESLQQVVDMVKAHIKQYELSITSTTI